MSIREHHLEVPRTARYHTAGDPRSSEECWFVLHGYRQLAARFIRPFAALPGVAVGRRSVVAPEALSRFYVEGEPGPHGPGSRVGASWMTRDDREREIRDYVRYLDRVAEAELGAGSPTSPPRSPRAGYAGGDRGPGPGTGSGRVVVLGFSQGAETASRWVALGRIRPDQVILWGGGIASDLDDGPLVDALTGVSVRLVVGTEDRWGAARAEESERRLTALGLPPRRVEYQGEHRIHEETLRAHWPL